MKTVDTTTKNEDAFLNLSECTQNNHCTIFILFARKLCETRDFSVSFIHAEDEKLEVMFSVNTRFLHLMLLLRL